MTANRAPGSSAETACSRNASRPSSSRFTQIRRAWNVRVAGSMRCHPPPAGRGAYDRRQRSRLRQRLAGARANDGARDPPGMALLPEAPNHIRQRRLVGRRNHLGRRRSARSIHPHVERPGQPKTESPRRVVELQRRHAQDPPRCRRPARARVPPAPARRRGSPRAPARPASPLPRAPDGPARARPRHGRCQSSGRRPPRATPARARPVPPCRRRRRRRAEAAETRRPPRRARAHVPPRCRIRRAPARRRP